MKRLILFCSLTFLAFNTLAQKQHAIDSILAKTGIIEEPPPFPTKEIINHIGSQVYIKDTIAGYKIVNKHLKLLYLGFNYPNQIATIVIKGIKTNKKLKLYQFGIGYFSGLAIMYQGKPTIFITNPDQVGMRVQI